MDRFIVKGNEREQWGVREVLPEVVRLHTGCPAWGGGATKKPGRKRSDHGIS
jgi:hypothetical protein